MNKKAEYYNGAKRTDTLVATRFVIWSPTYRCYTGQYFKEGKWIETAWNQKGENIEPSVGDLIK